MALTGYLVSFAPLTKFMTLMRKSKSCMFSHLLMWVRKNLTRLIAGEDPRFVLRRLIILAGEDIGLADPNGLQVATAAAYAFEYIGMPEGIFPIAEATLYLATAPKSNSTLAYFKARTAIEEEGVGAVPPHLLDPNRDAKGFGHGEGYQYPHGFEGHFTAQQYLPDEMMGRAFYKPSDQGYEAQIAERLQHWREIQAAALKPPEAIDGDQA